MGKIFSIFQRQSLGEQLEETENNINAVRKNRYQSQQRQKRIVASVTLWTLLLYSLSAASVFAYYFPSSWKMRVVYALPLCFGPVLAYVLRRIIMLYFTSRIKSSDEVLRSLIEKKKALLEQVREKESYKKAKEILEKYDPEVIKFKNMAEELQRLRSQSANSELRRRQLPHNASPNAALTVTPMHSHPRGAQFRNSPATTSSAMHQQRIPPGSALITPQRFPMHPMPTAPSSARSGVAGVGGGGGGGRRSTFDRVMEYIVGDGPDNKFALICSFCLNHNGMALKEEFQYVAFRCGYCGQSNPAKKERPTAPKLPLNLTSSPRAASHSADAVNITNTSSVFTNRVNNTTAASASTLSLDNNVTTESSSAREDRESGEANRNQGHRKNSAPSLLNFTADQGENRVIEDADENNEIETDDENEDTAANDDNSTGLVEQQEVKYVDGFGGGGYRDGGKEFDEFEEKDESMECDDMDIADSDNRYGRSGEKTLNNETADETSNSVSNSHQSREDEALSSEGSVDSVQPPSQSNLALDSTNQNKAESDHVASKLTGFEQTLPDLLQ
ncbi:endoplasmic reticulum junction formation protein lunapark-B-like isoform X2 [Symsagittifera roscoffensis]|uniref:endoplasmic reticulum junction formation protein lunapark-B-like isoform X2 n=1 Tax=Symsagittifera roscoffensis TaxID=84072 RepID=UPI00307C8340